MKKTNRKYFLTLLLLIIGSILMGAIAKFFTQSIIGGILIAIAMFIGEGLIIYDFAYRDQGITNLA